ncbi:MAG: 7-cyano-7-deazaguanine synthase QueC [Leptospiraceae bacterium]|nr:7-cyano-7-deazaguanine synthase QueC [Leptospiraceae bacterium]
MGEKRNKGAIVLFSGGLDSTTVTYMARRQGYRPLILLSFDYGQNHSIELTLAKNIAGHLECDHRIVRIDASLFQNTALVGNKIPVPIENRTNDESSENAIPVTYVPARNILFLSHALALAESLEMEHIFIGANAVDYSGYPDCRPEFYRAFAEMARLGMKAGMEGNPVRIHTPLIHMTKAQIIQTGVELGVDYGLTSSCYQPGPEGQPCGKCDSCRYRARGFKEAGIDDPLLSRF